MAARQGAISRRNFVGGGVGLAMASALAANTAMAGEEVGSVKYVDTVRWDAEYDLVVVGYGGAGGMASVVAADEGAKVLLVEKAPFGGGNTCYSEQVIFNYETKEAGQEFMHAMFEGFDACTDEEMDYIIDGSMANSDYVKKYLGASEGIVHTPVFIQEYSEEMPNLAEGSVYIGCLDGRWNQDKAYWNMVKDAVEARAENITVLFNTPAIGLVQDPLSKMVIGVTIEHEKENKNVRAKKGVILACGSYEANLDMWEQYRQAPTMYPIGTTYNTGDGIKMALEVGADLWHMAAISGPWLQPKKPGMNQCYFFNVSDDRFTKSGNSLVVGKDGRRFVDESASSRHGHIPYGGTFMPQVAPSVVYAIFDQTGYDSGGTYLNRIGDLPEEIIVKADTLEGLADQIEVDKQSFLDQVTLYNQYAAEGYDPQFGRNPEVMGPVETAPFYAVRLYGACVNCQGGPRRNTKCQVLDPKGNPIPHLYSAGELGSFWAGLYIAGGNLAETIYTGHDAAINALQESEEIPDVELVAVESTPEDFENALTQPTVAETTVLGEGEYLGTGIGMHGDIVVKVGFSNSAIGSVEVLKQMESPEIASKVWEILPQRIVDANSTEVDIISGATISSNGLIAAVNDALTQAGV